MIQGPSIKQHVYTDNVAHVYAHPQGLYGVIMSDKEYPSRVAFSLLNKILDEFLVKFPQDKWNPPMTYPELQNYLSKYQDPKQADSIMRVQNELDETTAILVRKKKQGSMRDQGVEILTSLASPMLA